MSFFFKCNRTEQCYQGMNRESKMAAGTQDPGQLTRAYLGAHRDERELPFSMSPKPGPSPEIWGSCVQSEIDAYNLKYKGGILYY